MYRTGRAAILLWRQASPEFTPATARPPRGWDVRVLRDSRVQLPQRRAGTSAGTNIAPGAGTLTLTGYAPSIAQPHGVTPGVGALTITGYAPTVEQVSGVQPGVGTLTLSGYAPTVTQSEAQAVFPGAGTLAFVGHAPTISQAAAPGNIFPPAGTVTITGHAPTVRQVSRVALDVWGHVLTNGLTAEQSLVAIHAALPWLTDLAGLHALLPGVPLVVTPTSRTAGSVSQSITEAGGTVTVERV